MVKKSVKSKVKKKIVKKKIPEQCNDNKFLAGVGIFIGVLLLLGFLPLIANGGVTGQVIEDDLKLGSTVVKGVYHTFLTPFFEFLLGENSNGEYFFAKVLFLIILFGIFYSSLGEVDFFGKNKFWLFFISTGLSILIMQLIGDSEILNTILLPYTAMGIAILAGGSFMIYFWLVEKGLSKKPAIYRRIAWVFFAVIFIALYFYRRDIALSIIYPLSALLSLLMAWFDGTLNKFMLGVEGSKAKTEINRGHISSLRQSLSDLAEQLKSGAIDIGMYKYESKLINDKIIALSQG